MAADGSGDPRGLYMSLDDIIEENNKGKKKAQNKSAQGESYEGGRGRGRGNRGAGRGRGYGRAGRTYQQPQQSQQLMNSSGPARNVRVVMHNQLPSTEYRQFQDCYRDDYGNVILTYKGTELVRISRAGDVTFNAQGHALRGGAELKSLNDALNCLDIHVKPSNANQTNIPSGNWNVVDGKALLRYKDRLILPAKGPQHAVRGQAMMTAIKHPETFLASAATAASNAAAAQAGLLPPGPYGFGANVGMMPYMQQQLAMAVPNLAGNTPMQNGNYSYSNGMGYGKDATQMRRDRARGRHLPY